MFHSKPSKLLRKELIITFKLRGRRKRNKLKKNVRLPLSILLLIILKKIHMLTKIQLIEKPT